MKNSHRNSKPWNLSWNAYFFHNFISEDDWSNCLCVRINLHSWTAAEKIKYKDFLKSDVWTDQAEGKYFTLL